MQRPVLPMLSLLVAASVLAGCADPAGSDGGATPTGGGSPAAAGGDAPDFGDAPDGAATGYAHPFAQTSSFPTRLASGGARVTDLSQARLGQTSDGEADARFPDADDGIVQMVVALTQVPPPATLTVRAAAPAGSAGGAYHLNVLFDRGMDGAWAGQDWVVQNLEVQLAPGGTVDVETPPFALTEALTLPHGAWMRVALTKERVETSSWDGTGAFSAGEIEDHVVTFPEVQGKLPAIPVMRCPAEVTFGDAPTVDVPCDLSNVAPLGHGSDVRWTLTRLSGGVAIDRTTDDVVLAPGASMVVTFTASKGEPLPSRWRYSAVGIDPPSRVTASGVEVGHGESEGETDFTETAKACAMLVAEIETSREHRAGESDAIFWVFVKQHFDDQVAKAVEGARVTGHVEQPGNPPVEGVTDAEGRAELRHTVHSYGEYGVVIDDVEKEGCALDRERSQLEATASVQPG